MADRVDTPDDSSLSRLFAEAFVDREAAWFCLAGGALLFEAGEPADQLYYLRAGRLGVFRSDEDGDIQFLGVIRPGEPVGEMALIAGGAHSARVVALRDSEILGLPREAFFDACEADPTVMTELARLMIRRSRQAGQREAVGDPSVFGFLAVADGVNVRPLADRVAQEIAGLGYSSLVVGVEAVNVAPEWFSEAERSHDFVLYVAENADLGWRQVVARQVDRLFRVARGGRAPPQSVAATSTQARPLQAQQLVDLILLHPRDADHASGSEAWQDAVQPARIFHLRRGVAGDVRRLARVITGRSVGLVLSGGGARAYAHVGAVRALRERGVPIDFVCGASMGAIVGAGVAMGWSNEELTRRIREAFVDTSPVDDIALPLLAMTQGRKVRERLAWHFGDTRIADLWIPFFCVSSNLTTGAYHMHRRGLLRDALRATVALPGILPPSTDGTDVLVDGAVLKNFPADLMRAAHNGPVIGVDVTRGRSITAADVARPESVWRWLASGQWRRGPPIVSLLMRAATVSTGRDLAASREATDLLVTPDLGDVEIRDWSAFEPAEQAGYAATIAALDLLHAPVTELRRRPKIQAPAAIAT